MKKICTPSTKNVVPMSAEKVFFAAKKNVHALFSGSWRGLRCCCCSCLRRFPSLSAYHNSDTQSRFRFEPRWHSALSRLDLPLLLFWGDSDAVAPMEIAKALARDHLNKDKFVGKTMKGAGEIHEKSCLCHCLSHCHAVIF